MHNHNHCHHDLRVCQQCDVAYCAKCGKEWGQHAHVQPYLPYVPITYPPWQPWRPVGPIYIGGGPQPSITWGTNTTGTVSNGSWYSANTSGPLPTQ